MATKTFDYSKWDNIELSDDESDLHPNIDKDSWFRLKHRTRIEREEKEDIETKKFEKLNQEDNERINIIKARLNGLKSGQAEDDVEFEDTEALEGELNELNENISKRNAYITGVRERRKWNIDNICVVKDEKTVIGKSSAQSLKAADFKPTGATESLTNIKTNIKNTESLPNPPAVVDKSNPTTIKPIQPPSGPLRSESPTRERFAVISYNDYVIAHEAILETYSEIRNLEETKEYLFKHCDILLHEHAQSYMLLSCLEDEMNGKRERMKLVCRQCQILTHIQELGTSLKRDPRDVILPFFKRIAESEYFKNFTAAVEDFQDKIIKRAVVKRQEMDAEASHPLGPGGLDPFEVLESLPNELKDAFESQNVENLQKVLSEMAPEDAKYHMKRCVDSGLWVPKDGSIFDESDEK
eukprot:CAMPEP_0196765060 /NCGR_PEP_ID=MMETSP1095-20130614/7482_1 /TAXON_ID=96789 ORGANISM="Chromulina nebulosa, Strain UTEXLB2642" /NCGR_SAMPLE_ID=MMETSP1095 /ASSEMBLY_ACC=CAM_ASM_000446 /LENGTH=411 /DNA_ID=CAMNT_0042122327 /DNA_START=32 /DNA_END=1267 /DNA_ORIENTATION=+